MVFRAKITVIYSFVKAHLDLDKFNFVRDSKDVYIEVCNEELAEAIERLNELECKKCKLSRDLISLFNKYY